MDEKLDKEIEVSPKDYFEILKSKKKDITDEELLRVYDNCLTLLNKYNMTGQKTAMKKLIFHLETIKKERELVKLGITTFVYRDDVDNYIDNVAKNVVKIIELENYDRDIPDEIVEVIAKVKDIFDQLYIVFTDYTGKVEQKVEKKRREKDPILFGTFQSVEEKSVVDRFYFLGDWEDEYCDLTLDKMVNEMKSKANTNIIRTFNTPEDIQELKQQLNNLEEVKDTHFKIKEKTVKSFFNHVKTFFKE